MIDIRWFDKIYRSPMEFSDVKITVIKKLATDEIFEEYAKEEAKPSCSADVVHLALGGEFPWMKREGTMISCCTDGLRPVLYKLERI